MSVFMWKDRMACIRRIQVVHKCRLISADKAIKEALFYMHPKDHEYAFCLNPDKITGSEIELLRRDAEAYIELCKKRVDLNKWDSPVKGKEDKARQLTISGIEDGIAEVFIPEPIISKRFITEKQLHRAYTEQGR